MGMFMNSYLRGYRACIHEWWDPSREQIENDGETYGVHCDPHFLHIDDIYRLNGKQMLLGHP